MTTLKRHTPIVHRNTAIIATLGALGFAAQFACSAEAPPRQQGTFTNAGSANTAGTPAATGGSAGTFGAVTAGTGFGAGSDAGGSGGTGGTGETAAGTAGTATGGVPPVIVVPPFCEGKPTDALPFEVTTAFYESGWQGDHTQISIPTLAPEANACTEALRPAGHVGNCSKWRYTPAAAAATWAAVAWVNRASDQYTHDPVCLANGAKRITFYARGVLGGEKISVGGAGAQEVTITLTNAWKQYEISLEGVLYNPPEGVFPSGFSWKVDPLAPPDVTPITEFFIDSIQIVSTASDPGGQGGASGEGGEGSGN